ncbi:MAG: hypothetical protein WCK70_05080 [Chloroflexales bacterium]|jgi:hypothetical protein
MDTWLMAGWPAVALATAVIFLAGLSEGLGRQGVILLVNRVTPLRVALNLALTALLYLLSALLWVAVLWLVAALTFHDAGSLRQAFVTISTAYLPLLLGALALLPYFGPLIRRCLHLWSLLAALAAISSTFGLSLGQSILCALLGWLLLQGLRWTLSAPAAVFSRKLWQMSTGHAAQLGVADLPLVIPGYAPPDGTR